MMMSPLIPAMQLTACGGQGEGVVGGAWRGEGLADWVCMVPLPPGAESYAC